MLLTTNTNKQMTSIDNELDYYIFLFLKDKSFKPTIIETEIKIYTMANNLNFGFFFEHDFLWEIFIYNFFLFQKFNL